MALSSLYSAQPSHDLQRQKSHADVLCLKLQLASHASNERSVLRPELHGAPLVVVGGGATMVEAVATAVTAAGTADGCVQKPHVLHEHRGQWLPE